jgi:hypothetical protein
MEKNSFWKAELIRAELVRDGVASLTAVTVAKKFFEKKSFWKVELVRAEIVHRTDGRRRTPSRAPRQPTRLLSGMTP